MFASDYVQNKVYQTIQCKDDQCLMTFLHTSAGKPLLSGPRGQLFESKAHSIISNGGTFKVRRLSNNCIPGEVEKLQLAKLEEVLFNTLDETSSDPNTS